MTPQVEMRQPGPGRPDRGGPAADEPEPAGPVIGVVGACGGAGASSLAALLAACPPGPAGPSTLVDLDPLGGGADLLLGLEQAVGARWSDIRLGGGALPPEALRGRLPAAGRVGVLACDPGAQPGERDVEPLLSAAVRIGPVVVDLPRWLPPPAQAALAQMDAVVVLVPGEVAALMAAAALLERLRVLVARAIPVLRPGRLDPSAAARVLTCPPVALLPRLPWLGGDDGGVLQVHAVPRAAAAVAARIWALAPAPSGQVFA